VSFGLADGGPGIDKSLQHHAGDRTTCRIVSQTANFVRLMMMLGGLFVGVDLSLIGPETWIWRT